MLNLYFVGIVDTALKGQHYVVNKQKNQKLDKSAKVLTKRLVRIDDAIVIHFLSYLYMTLSLQFVKPKMTERSLNVGGEKLSCSHLNFDKLYIVFQTDL